MFWIAFAVVFVFVLFFLKNKTTFKNPLNLTGNGQENGLTYSTLALKDLVNKDTDGDGILDWEEGLWGKDPLKKETARGIPDSVTITKLKAEQRTSDNDNGQGESSPKEESLTQTDKFSRELFSTVATLSQNGAIDEATVEKIGDSLADHIQNTAPRKVFLISDIKTTNENSVQSFTTYNNALNNIYKIYTVNYTVLDVLQKFTADENNVDASILKELDPIIEQTKKAISAMVKMTVPQALLTLHLNIINVLQRLVENISDIRLYDSDVIVTLSGINEYGENATKLESGLNSLVQIIDQKLNN